MDFSKAFNKVEDHKRFLLKSHRFGINNNYVITWIGSFLSNRTWVVLEGEESNTCPVTSGVPQGFVLGPCLFLLCINDMPYMVESNIRLFPKDTILYLTVSKQTDCQALQSDLSKLETWESEWLMAFNTKTLEIQTCRWIFVFVQMLQYVPVNNFSIISGIFLPSWDRVEKPKVFWSKTQHSVTCESWTDGPLIASITLPLSHCCTPREREREMFWRTDVQTESDR